MTNVEPTIEAALLIVPNGEKPHPSEPGRGVVTIGRKPPGSVQIDNPQFWLRLESANGQWWVVSSGPNGIFRRRTAREFGDGHRQSNCSHGRSHGRQGVDV
jgi:hypothetical protein